MFLADEPAVDRGAARADRAAQHPRQIVDHPEIILAPNPPAAGNDDPRPLKIHLALHPMPVNQPHRLLEIVEFDLLLNDLPAAPRIAVPHPQHAFAHRWPSAASDRG